MTASESTDGNDTARAEDLRVVTAVISEITGLPVESIVPEADLIEDLYIDSVAKIELVVACQERIGVTIPDDVVTDLRTVSSILDYLAMNRVLS